MADMRFQDQPFHQALIQPEEFNGFQRDEDTESSEEPSSKDDDLLDPDLEVPLNRLIFLILYKFVVLGHRWHRKRSAGHIK